MRLRLQESSVNDLQSPLQLHLRLHRQGIGPIATNKTLPSDPVSAMSALSDASEGEYSDGHPTRFGPLFFRPLKEHTASDERVDCR